MARNLNLRILASGAIDLKGVSEYDFQVAVTRYAEANHWRVQYFRKTAVQGKDGNWRGLGNAGWVDLFMVREGRALAAELKSERGSPKREQLEWLELLNDAGIETAIWKPRHSAEIIEALT